MGEVFKARHRRLGRLVAVKVLLPKLLADPRARARFEREARAVAQLAHPNIVAVHDAGLASGIPYVSFEYLTGRDLSKLSRPLADIAVICNWVRQAALGLQHAHEQGLIHRDVKPSNLFLTSPGEVVKVLDFGIAALRPRSKEQTTPEALTQEGVAMGTVDFMAPEQADGARHVDARADLYSLGCTLYFLLTGQVPFPGGSMLDKLMHHRHSEPIPVEQLRPALPPGLGALTRAMMAKRPDDRPATAGAVAEALARFLPTQPSPVTPVGSTPRIWRIGAACGVLVMLAVIGVFLLQSLGSSPTDPPSKGGSPAAQVLDSPAPKSGSGPSPTPGRWGQVPAHPVHFVVFCPDAADPLVAIGGADSRISLCHPQTGVVKSFLEPPQNLRQGGPNDHSSAAAHLAGRNLLAAGRHDGKMLVWDVRSRTVLGHSHPHREAVTGVAFLPPEGKILASVSDGGDLALWDWESRKEPIVHQISPTDLEALAAHPLGRYLAYGGKDGKVRLRDMTSGKEEILGQFQAVWSLAFSPKGDLLAVGSGEEELVGIWDLNTRQRRTAKGRGAIACLGFSPDGNLLAWGDTNPFVVVWDVTAHKQLADMDGHSQMVRGLTFAPDGSFFLTGSEDGTVRVWRTEDAKLGKGH